MAKNFSKKLKAAAGKSKFVDAWKSSLVNHLWWSAQTCKTNREVLEEKHKSVLNHIANIHEWQNDGTSKYVHKCEHETLSQKKSIVLYGSLKKHRTITNYRKLF